MRKKTLMLKILLITLLLFTVFCSGSQSFKQLNYIEKTSEEALIQYLSSGALNNIPKNVGYVMKIDSISEIYDNFQFEYIESLMSEKELKDVKEELGFVPFDRNELAEFTGINIQNPSVLALTYLNDKNPVAGDELSKNDVALIVAVPYNDKQKLKTEITKDVKTKEKTVGDLTVYTDEKNTSAVFFLKDYMHMLLMPGLIDEIKTPEIKMPMIEDKESADEQPIDEVPPTEEDKEKKNAEKEKILIQAVESIINLPEDKSLAKSKEYKEHLKNSDRRSIWNNYLHYGKFFPMLELFYDDFGLANQFGGIGNNNLFRSFESDSILYSITDMYFTTYTIELTHYYEYKDGEAEKLDKEMLVTDIMKSIPGNLTSLFYLNNGNYDDKAIKKILEIYEDMPQIDKKEIENIIGISLKEFFEIVRSEGGGGVADLDQFPNVNFMYYLGVNDVEKMKIVIDNINNHIRNELQIQIKEEKDRYIINMGIFKIVYGIVGDKVLICSGEEYFDKVVSGKENTSKKVSSKKLKTALYSKGIQGLFHIDFDDLFDALATLPMVQQYEDIKKQIEKAKDIYDEMNFISYNTETSSEGIFEMKFETKDFMKKIYELLNDLAKETFKYQTDDKMQSHIQSFFDNLNN